MIEYSVIPMFDTHFGFGNFTLREYLGEYFPYVYKMEYKYLEMPFDNNRKLFYEKVKRAYDIVGIPQYLLVYSNNGCCFEFATNIELWYKVPILLQLKKCKSFFCMDSMYCMKVNNYFRPELIDINKRVPIVDFKKAKCYVLRDGNSKRERL